MSNVKPSSNNIFDAIRNNPKFNQSASSEWFMRNVRQMSAGRGIGPMKVLGDNLMHQTSTVIPGRMYMFTYSPKFKEKLPFWDSFPLVIPFSTDGKHFTGLNLHYLYPKVRLGLLDKLMEFVDDDSLSPRTRMLLSWNLLSNVSKFPEVRGAVKMYLFGYVKSRFFDVPPVDWKSAVFLPVERFHGADNSSVWANPLRKR